MREKIAEFGKTKGRTSKRLTLEVKGVRKVIKKPITMKMRPLLKREASKSRWLYPLDTTGTMYFGFLAMHFNDKLAKSGHTDLGKPAFKVISRRKFLFQSLKAKSVYCSDDGKNFNESHSLQDMRHFLVSLADAYSAISPAMHTMKMRTSKTDASTHWSLPCAMMVYTTWLRNS